MWMVVFWVHWERKKEEFYINWLFRLSISKQTLKIPNKLNANECRWAQCHLAAQMTGITIQQKAHKKVKDVYWRLKYIYI